MARYRRKVKFHSGGGTIVLLFILIGMVLLGSMLLIFCVADSSANDVSGTSLEGAGQITETGVKLVSSLTPLVLILLTLGVIVVALVFVYRHFFRKKRYY